MSTPKPKFLPVARGWTQEQVCARMGISVSFFQEHKEKLYLAGLPRPDPLTGRTDSRAVERWMDRRSGLVADAQAAGPEYQVDAAPGEDAALNRVKAHYGKPHA